MFTHTKFQYNQLHDLATKLAQDLQTNHGYTIDHTGTDYTHWHKGNHHWHVDTSNADYWVMAKVTGFIDASSVNLQPGYINQAEIQKALYDYEYDKVGDAHLFSSAHGFILYFSVVHKADNAKHWLAALSCEVEHPYGQYDDLVIYTGASNGTFEENTTSLAKIMNEIGSSLYAKFTGAYADYTYDLRRQRLEHPESFAMTPLYTAGTQGGYKIMEKPKIFIKEQQGHNQFVGSIEGLYVMSKAGRIPFEEFTLNSKKYISCPSFHAIEIV